MTELAYSRQAETTSEFGGGLQAIRQLHGHRNQSLAGVAGHRRKRLVGKYDLASVIDGQDGNRKSSWCEQGRKVAQGLGCRLAARTPTRSSTPGALQTLSAASADRPRNPPTERSSSELVTDRPGAHVQRAPQAHLGVGESDKSSTAIVDHVGNIAHLAGALLGGPKVGSREPSRLHGCCQLRRLIMASQRHGLTQRPTGPLVFTRGVNGVRGCQ